MKRTTLGTMITLMMLLVATPTFAAEQPNLVVSMLSYTPVPAEPGNYVTVTLKVLNNGDGGTTAATIEFEDNYPFSVDDEASKIKQIGRLGPQEDFLAEFRVRIDSAAIDGTNYLKVKITPDGNNPKTVSVPLTVNSVQKTLSINSITITPETITPGEKMKVDFKLKNLGASDLRDVSLQLNLAGMLVGTTYIDIPLVPIGSSVEKRVALLQSGQTTDFEFVLQAYPEAEAGIYKIPITLTYTDATGTESTRTDLFGIAINGDTEVLIQLDESTLYSDNGKGDVTISITNKGLAEIKFLSVKLEETDEFSIQSLSDEVYVGNVDSDDYETADFTLKMETQGLDQVTLPVTLTFKDALNEEHVIKKELSLPLITTAEAGKEKSKTGTYITIAVAVFVIGFFLYRRSKRKSKHS